MSKLPLISVKDVDAVLAERSLYEFVKVSWPILHPSEKFVDGWHIGAICEHLEALVAGEIKKLLINIAIKMTKSLIASVDLPAWTWIHWPSSTWLYCSYSKPLASEHSVYCRRLIESEWYQHYWSQRFQLTSDQNEKMRFDNDQHGSRAAYGMTSVTGHGALFNCVPGWVKIATNKGQIAIEEIVNRRLPVKIFGSSGKFQDIVSRQSNGTKKILEIKTDSAVLHCTEDHPIWTNNGFIPAKDLLLSSRIRRLNDDFYLRAMRKKIQSRTKACDAKKAMFVLKEMFRQLATRREQFAVEGGQNKQDLRLLWQFVFRRSRQFAALLQEEVLGALANDFTALARMCLLRNYVSSRGQATNLLHAMQERFAWYQDEQGRKFELPSWQMESALCAGVYQTIEERNHRTRSSHLLRMQENKIKIERASFGRKQDESLAREPDNALSWMPQFNPSRPRFSYDMAREEIVRSIRILCEYPVYNLNVTPDHDYFANGILTHNCVDDPHDRNDWKFPNEIKRSVDAYDADIYSAVNDPINCRRLVIAQRVSSQDLSDHLMKQGGWETLIIPTEYDPKRSRVTCIGWKDPRKKAGELACPKRWGPQEVLVAKKNRRLFAAHHQQSPSEDEGAIFKRVNWRYYKDDPKEIAAYMDVIIQSWDLTSGGVEPGSSKVAGHVWGMHGANKFLLDRCFDYMDLPQTIKAIRDMSMRWPKAKAKVIEVKAAGAGVIAMLRDEIAGIIAWPPQGEKMDSKVTRAYLVQPDHEAGNLWLPNPETVPWASEVVEYCVMFPESEFDDDVDAMSQALAYLERMPKAVAPIGVGQSQAWLR